MAIDASSPPGPAVALALDEAVRRFLDDLAVGRARATAETYRYALRRFGEYLAHARAVPPRTVGELTEDDPVGFARWIADGGRAPRTTVHLYTTAVARLYAYLVRERHRPDLPLETIRLRLAQLRGKRPKKLPRVPTDDVMARVLAAAHAVPRAGARPAELIRLRDVAILETLRGSGLRVSEAVSLRRADLERDRQRAVMTGKGGKQRLVFFTDDAWRAIWTYLDASERSPPWRSSQSQVRGAMRLKSILLIHRVAGPLALATVALFLAATVAVELRGDAAAVVFVRRAILLGLVWLVLVMAAAGGTGRALGARFRRTPPLEAKTRRMPFIAANGLLVLVPSAVALDHLAQLGDVGPVFAALQAVELVAGATNLVLLALMARARRPAAPLRRDGSRGCSPTATHLGTD